MTDPGTRQTELRPRTPKHLWAVGVLSLLWHAMAVFDFTATMTRMESYMSQFTAEQLEYFYGFPTWMIVVWALAVFGGLAGSIGLLLRKKWAVTAFVASVLGLALSSLYNFVLSNGAEIMGSVAVYFTLAIWIIAIFLIWYSRRQAQAGVLR